MDECSATVDGNVCAEVGGDLSRSDRRGNKSTAGSFTCKKGVSESDAISDVAKWVDWLRSVQSWCEALGDCFAKCFVQDEQCRKLLFFVLGILPSVEGLPSSTVVTPEVVLNKAAIGLLLLHDNAEVRQGIVKKGFFDDVLKQLETSSGVEPRRLLSDGLLEPEPEPVVEQSAPPDEVLRRVTSAEEFLKSAKKKTPKKKGVGYGVDGADDSSWNVDAKFASDRSVAPAGG